MLPWNIIYYITLYIILYITSCIIYYILHYIILNHCSILIARFWLISLSLYIYTYNIYIYIYIYITEKFTEMQTKVFVLLEVFFLMYIFTHYWQKWLVEVILYRHEVQIRLKLICLNFIFMVREGHWLSQCSVYAMFMFTDSE